MNLLGEQLEERCVRPDVIFLQEFSMRKVADFSTEGGNSVLIGSRRGKRKTSAIWVSASQTVQYRKNLDFAIALVTLQFVAVNVHLPCKGDDDFFRAA